MATTLFSVRMVRDDSLFGGGVPARRCEMTNFTEEIVAAGGYWEETEIDENRAIVRVRARDPLLNSIGLVHKRLSETEARSLWTPTRKAPFYNRATDTIEFHEAERHACKPLEELVSRVPEGAASIEVVALLGLWGAIGFGQGFRLPLVWCQWLAEHGIAPGGLWFEVLMRTIFDQHGVFPTAPHLDDFNRANENPLADGNWSGPWFGAEDELQILSNVVAADTAPGNSAWTAETFGLDSEIRLTIATVPADGQNIGLGLRLVDLGANVDGYLAIHVQLAAAADFFRYFRVDNGVPTVLGSDINQVLAANDGMGLEMIGSTLTVNYNTGSGWTAVSSRSDSTYTAAGNIGLRLTDTTARLDNVGGGNVTGALRILTRTVLP